MDSKRKPGLGIIGCGWAGRNLHLQAYGDLVSPVACCARSEETAGAFLREFGFRRAYTDYAALLRDPEIDLVVIATPATNHVAIAVAAAEAGKATFLEKPIAWERPGALRVVEAFDRASVPLAINDQDRFFPQVEAAAALLRGGLLGAPFAGAIETSTHAKYGPYPEQSRGFVIEMIVHNFDVLRAILADEVVEVYCRMGRGPYDYHAGDPREFWAAITLTFSRGTLVQGFHSWDCQGGNVRAREGRLHLECERGTLHLNRDATTPVSAYSADLGAWVVPEAASLPAGLEPSAYASRRAMERFIECLTTGKPHPVSGREYMKTMDIAFAAYESATANVPVKLPLSR